MEKDFMKILATIVSCKNIQHLYVCYKMIRLFAQKHTVSQHLVDFLMRKAEYKSYLLRKSWQISEHSKLERWRITYFKN